MFIHILTYVFKLVSKKLHKTIRVLDYAGEVHYESRHMRSENQRAFERIIRLIQEDKYFEAENAAGNFDFPSSFPTSGF